MHEIEYSKKKNQTINRILLAIYNINLYPIPHSQPHQILIDRAIRYK